MINYVPLDTLNTQLAVQRFSQSDLPVRMPVPDLNRAAIMIVRLLTRAALSAGRYRFSEQRLIPLRGTQ